MDNSYNSAEFTLAKRIACATLSVKLGISYEHCWRNYMNQDGDNWTPQEMYLETARNIFQKLSEENVSYFETPQNISTNNDDLPDHEIDRLNEHALELQKQFREHYKEISEGYKKENKVEPDKRLVFEAWAIQKLANIEILIYDLVERLSS